MEMNLQTWRCFLYTLLPKFKLSGYFMFIIVFVPFNFNFLHHSAVQSHPYFCFYFQNELRANRANQANQDLCCVCLERKKTVVFLPCQHQCTCEECSDQLSTSMNKCPMCTGEIMQRVLPFK